MKYKIFPCTKCGKIELSKKNKSGLCRHCGMLNNTRGVGRKLSEKHIKILSDKMVSDKNPMWKGKDAGIKAIHIWVKTRYLKPDLCEICKINKPIDLANISQKYHRNLTDWEWLCRRCHMIKDGRMNNLKRGRCGKTEETKQ